MLHTVIASALMEATRQPYRFSAVAQDDTNGRLPVFSIMSLYGLIVAHARRPAKTKIRPVAAKPLAA